MSNDVEGKIDISQRAMIHLLCLVKGRRSDPMGRISKVMTHLHIVGLPHSSCRTCSDQAGNDCLHTFAGLVS